MRGVLLLALGLCAAGCSYLDAQIDRPLDWDDANFVEGKTHYRAVLARMGPPAKLTRADSGVAFLYESMRLQEGQVGLSIDDEGLGISIQWLQFIKFAYGKAWSDRQALVLTFDRDGILTSEQYRDWEQAVGTGFTVQFVAQAGSVVDSTAVRRDVDPNRWGRRLLRPLAQGLNNPNSVDDGRYGLEQRGTPVGVGQRSLELRKRPKQTILPSAE